MPTTWTWRATVSTTWGGRAKLQSDLWYITDEIDQIFTNENLLRLVFHNWVFYNQETQWEQRPAI